LAEPGRHFDDVEDEGSSAIPPQYNEKRVSLQESFLRRKVEEYGFEDKVRRSPMDVVDLDAEPVTEEAKAAALDQRVSLRERFWRRRVQAYTSAAAADAASPADPAAPGSVKDAYFGRDAPPAFDFQIDAVDLEREMAASNKEAAEAAEAAERLERTMNNRKRFLQRRVQEYK
jgi:hypothetical protein